MSVHITEEEVKDYVMKEGAEKARHLQLLKNKGNHAHNVKVLKDNRGFLHVCRSPSDPKHCDPKNFMPCHMCLLWISHIGVHKHVCSNKKGKATKKASRNFMMKSRTNMTEGKYLGIIIFHFRKIDIFFVS